MEELKKTDKRTDDRYDWIDNGIDELKEDDGFDIVLKPVARIPQARYEELVKAEATLEILGKMLAHKHPYEFELYQTIAGKYIPSEEKGEAE